jgi:hypothetical protein
MHRLTLNITDNAYNNILYFLKNLSADVEIISDKITSKNSKKMPTSLRGAFKSYADVSKIHLEDSSSQQYVVDNYKKENS